MSHEQPLPAGRELDAMVAEKVMGWHREQRGTMPAWNQAVDGPNPNAGAPLTWWVDGAGAMAPHPFCSRFAPSSDIAAAWLVVEKMMERMTFGLDWLGFDGEEWRCIFAWTKGEHDTQKPYAADADTAPLAICRAALLAVGVTGEP